MGSRGVGTIQVIQYNTIQNNRTQTLGSKEVDTKTNIRWMGEDPKRNSGGMCISENSQTKKRKRVVYRSMRREKNLHQNDDLWNCPTFLHLCLSVHSQWKWLYHNSPQCRVTIDNLVDSHFGVQYPQLVLGVSQISKWFLSLAYIQQFR